MPKPCRSAVLAKEKRRLAKGSGVAGKRESGVGTAGFSPKPGPTRQLGAAERRKERPVSGGGAGVGKSTDTAVSGDLRHQDG